MNEFLFVLFLRSKPMKNAVIKSFHSNVRKLVRHAVSFHYNNEFSPLCTFMFLKMIICLRRYMNTYKKKHLKF